MEILVHSTPLKQPLDAVLVETIRQDAVFIHQICHENQSAGLRHALRLIQRLQLLFISYQMIQRTEQQRYVCRCRRDKRHVSRIALHHIGCRLTLQKHLYVAAYQLHRLHPIALCHECRSVAARPGADVKKKVVGLQKPAQMVHSGFKLYDTVPTLQAQVFRMLVVMLLYIG